MNKLSYLCEVNQPAKFVEASSGKSGAILGKLQAPFFDLNAATRNGRDYREAAKDALESEEFKEKLETRTFFGRLGHPCTQEEMAEDPAVRACVVMTDYKKNDQTNMYECTLEILNNQYGRQLKSLIDAGCVMGVSTRGSGESYEDCNGNEVIAKGTYSFEALDIVTLPAVKSARVTVLESFDTSKRKKLEELIESANDRNVLDALKVTVESSNMPNKKALLEAIDKKLSGGVETIESLVNDIALLTENLNKAEKLRKEAEDKLEAMSKKLTESSESAGTTEMSKSDVSESIKKLVTILQSSNNVIECMKKELKSEKDLSKNLKAGTIRARSNIERLQTEAKRIQARNEVLEADCKAYLTANKRLHESLEEAKKKNSLLQESLNASKKLIESKNSKVNKEMTESIKGYKDKIRLLESNNSRLMNESAVLRSKYIESMALAYGISLDALKAKVKPDSTPAMIESAAKSIRELEDARRIALSDPIKLGTKVESSKVQFEDPELSRAGRIASLLT